MLGCELWEHPQPSGASRAQAGSIQHRSGTVTLLEPIEKNYSNYCLMQLSSGEGLVRFVSSAVLEGRLFLWQQCEEHTWGCAASAALLRDTTAVCLLPLWVEESSRSCPAPKGAAHPTQCSAYVRHDAALCCAACWALAAHTAQVAQQHLPRAPERSLVSNARISFLSGQCSPSTVLLRQLVAMPMAVLGHEPLTLWL